MDHENVAGKPGNGFSASGPGTAVSRGNESRGASRRTALSGVAPLGNRFWTAVFAAWLGDGLGRLVQFFTWDEIREMHGDQGITRLDPRVPEERMSDGGVSLMVLTLDGLIRADRARVAHHDDPFTELERVYRLWAAGEARGSSAGGWLAADHFSSQLAESRAVALLREKLIGGPDSYPVQGVSPLCSAIPMSGWSSESGEVVDFVARAMQLTGQSAATTATAKVLAVMIQQNVMADDYLHGISYVVEGDPDRWGEGGAEVLEAVNAARGLARYGITPGEIESLGSGETPASALAIAVCAVLSAEEKLFGQHFEEVLRIAVNHSGNSSLTGALAGAIVTIGRRSSGGMDSVWGKGLLDYQLVSKLARDASDQLGSQRGELKRKERYPALWGGEVVSPSRQDDGEERLADVTPTPTLIGAYSKSERSLSQRVAEFRWSPDSGVAVEIFDKVAGDVARSYFHAGIWLHSENRTVLIGEGPAFMRALLLTPDKRYYRFVDESADEPVRPSEQQASAAQPEQIAQPLTLDERVVLETRGRSTIAADREWRDGKRVMRYWDAQRVRRVFGRSSDEFCRALRYDRTIKDVSVIHGVGTYFPFAVQESLLADVVARGRLSAAGQMTLFCLDAVVRTETWRRQTGELIPRTIGLVGLLRWLHTQGVPWNRVVTADILDDVPEPTGWLIELPELFERRDPDPVCIDALSAFAEKNVTGWFSKPINNARTPSAVPRAIALAAWSDIPERVFEQAVANALLTHGHPDAYLSAGAYAVLVNTLLSGGTLGDGIEIAVDELAKWPDENVQRLLRSCELTGRRPSAGQLSVLVEDGAAPNALAVAVVAAARDDDFVSAVRRAAGVLPEAAPLVGGLHGARNGEQGFPRKWLGRMELWKEVERLAFDVAAVQVGLPDRVWTSEWAGPYPGF
ncbi:ADP-ribosylglycohydrolase family protein [Saccharopolyspora indica]|uniref:ADP-ribosylglycohydrolase family protein n=1 Tax=Saccharopolyspora indica TaxID=1229659 RepID=UPI0022EB8606|nr:ADP-ribosylglycohydrolase family protein [Saccharopolyspora indica]MDA3647246.1 ADP-ribosylglycohydrolase family protein [Saccharopolyspora indica]